MSLHTGDSIGQYRILQEFTGGANCNWTFAERDGAEFFVKEFHRPKYPPDSIAGALRAEKLRRCTAFETRHKSLVAAMSRVCAPGGNIVMPLNFFRLNLVYYHIAPRIEITSLTPGEIAALPPRERLVLLRLLSRSLLTLHSQRIVHGDLKPSNILIHRSDGGLLAPKLIDFDGSFFDGEPPDQADMAFDQNYMAPEILAYNKEERGGVSPKQLGTPADIFSFGILMQEYWTGQRPALEGDHTYVAEAVRMGAAVQIDLPGMEPRLQRLARQALSLDTVVRPSVSQIDQAIGEALTALRASKGEKPSPVGPDEGLGVVVRLGRIGGVPRTGAAGIAEPRAPLSLPATKGEVVPHVVIRMSPNLKESDR